MGTSRMGTSVIRLIVTFSLPSVHIGTATRVKTSLQTSRIMIRP